MNETISTLIDKIIDCVVEMEQELTLKPDVNIQREINEIKKRSELISKIVSKRRKHEGKN